MSFINDNPDSPNTQGWKQFLSAREEMINSYERAKTKVASHKVKVNQGRVAEAEFRKWLSSFLPKRYGVTSGYIISQGLGENDFTPHYDVIIYDQFESPILWSEDNPDHSQQGRILAIPAPFVKGVIEVKSVFKSSTVKESIDHLSKLKVLSGGSNANSEMNIFLPDDFFCYTVFFEYRAKDKGNVASLNNFIAGNLIRGFKGGLILKYENDVTGATGRIQEVVSKQKIEVKADTNSDTFFFNDEYYFAYYQNFSIPQFSFFAFDLIRLLNPGFGASFYAFGSPDAKFVE
jgi:hypothetical protein